MDESVARALQKWPNVPAVYGWLRLGRRGEWLIKGVTGSFERVAHRGMQDFIGRNYLRDESGRWYLQNGPQRVFVTLDYTPWVYRLNDVSSSLIAHTGLSPTTPRGLYLDDTGALLLETELGIGLVLDRDLPQVLERLQFDGQEPVDSALEKIAAGAVLSCRLYEQAVPLVQIRAADVPTRFQFVQQPVPPTGQPDC